MNAPTPPIRKGRKFDQVLDGACQVFLACGFEAANMDQVARAAQVSKATVYSYFPDKQRLFIEVVKNECLKQADSAVELIDRNMPVKTVLTQAAQHILRIILSDFSTRIFRICVAEADRFPDLGRKFYESGPMLGRSRMCEYFKNATERGELNITDCELAADQFTELCKADIWPRVIFGITTKPTQAEIDRVVSGAVSTFLARYGV